MPDIKLSDVPLATIIQVRLKCAEIVFTAGSQYDRAELDSVATKLYNFTLGIKEKK